MTVASGSIAYSLGEQPCSGVGVTWLPAELDNALEGPVASVIFDDRGKEDIRAILEPLAETEFMTERLEEVLGEPTEILGWLVGEAIAACYLSSHRGCTFPWFASRDQRKGGSSLPGADLVGFGEDQRGHCFAFGEVKTSAQKRCPPGVVHGKQGLRQQLVDLHDNKAIRDGLLRYLCHRVKGASWHDKLKIASKRYLDDSSDVQLFGFLVRDVPPNMDDLGSLVQRLAEGLPIGTHVEVIALYLPQGSIDGMGRAVRLHKDGART